MATAITVFLNRSENSATGMIDLDEKMADRVVVLMPDLPLDEQGHQHRRERDGQKAREQHGEGLGIGKRLEQPARLVLERKDRQEPDGDHEQREKERRPHFLRRVDDHVNARTVDAARLLPVFELFVGVLDHDDRGVHHGADGDGDAGEAHDVRADPQIVHADKGDEDGDRQRQDHDQGARQMEQEDDADHAHGQAELDRSLP